MAAARCNCGTARMPSAAAGKPCGKPMLRVPFMSRHPATNKHGVWVLACPVCDNADDWPRVKAR